MISLKRAFWATTCLTGALMLATAASAQTVDQSAPPPPEPSAGEDPEDDATAVSEVVVTAARGIPTFEGLAAAENASRARATLTQEYLSTQTAGQSILNSTNILPGVNFTNNDAYGSSGGDITLRGFDSARVSLQFDGIPLNDTGNYAIFPNQQLDPEIIERANVNLGTTEVDSPTASATGGTINYVTLRPRRDFGFMVQPSIGSWQFGRIFAQVDTGEFDLGPGAISAFATYSRTDYDHFKDFGGVDKEQWNARVYYDMGDGNFASLAVNYNENRNNFTQRVTLTQFDADTAYQQSTQAFCNRPSVRGTTTEFGPFVGLNGVANVDPSCGGVFRSLLNPSDTGNVRGQFSYGLTDQLRFTFDPSFQYVLANGGGSQQFSERDAQIRGASAAAGLDLNGDGDILDTVALYRPNTTNTRRYGLVTGLTYDINDEHRVRAVYTYDRGRHRQTGDVGFIDAAGDPESVFGGKDGEGRQVLLPDGTNLRRRDRYSIASLNQFSAEYRGDFFDRAVRINAGVRLPYFERELNNYCFQRDTFNAYCTTQAGTPVAGRPGFFTFPVSALNPSAANVYGAPRSFEVEYDDVLPNLGISWRFAEYHQLYAAYAEGLSAPRTDDLYDQVIVNPEPETTRNFDIGYRFQSPVFNFSIGAFNNNFKNRIVRTFDEAAGIFASRNIGEVDLRGVDGELGWRVTDDFTLYASASYIDTEVQNDQPRGVGLAPFPTAGTELVEIPDFQTAVRANYTLRDVNVGGVELGNFEFGAQVKYVGERFATDVNDEVAPDYTTVDLDVRWDLASIGWEGSFLQLNVVNLFDEEYLGDISSNTNRFPIPGVIAGTPGVPLNTAAQYQLGVPTTVMLTLRARFF